VPSTIQTVVVGSLNPVKVAAVRAVILRHWPQAEVWGVSVPSGVPDQPWGDDETIRGAGNRARAAQRETGASLAIGLEGGCVRLSDGSARTCAWAVAVDATGRESVGGSLSMPLPAAVTAELNAGAELGHAIDTVAGTVNVKHGQGAVGILTAGLVDRQGAYEVLVAYALSPWLAPDFWADHSGR
jgi:inosine/xanthosine triphosphatase